MRKLFISTAYYGNIHMHTPAALNDADAGATTQATCATPDQVDCKEQLLAKSRRPFLKWPGAVTGQGSDA